MSVNRSKVFIAEAYQGQIEALKRQQELDELFISQGKKRLLAEQELAN